ncbi:hypothetical protein I7I50_07058 [Histoplasma capsulatum G186AR]|uniref:Uncharacterized protein n=1 Tax=Ajellomyces capsulatus TaxID=5037 RepID=A0A8H7YW10_AJECA|nr:hypothetical protein I7I52_09858 [Histoplasma capsulatum]QSS67858.1 hypothetical protein I7I50_07058 [Histoplasma capsulatum G186AR]
MSPPRSPGLTIRATSSFATAFNISRWSRPLPNNSASYYLSMPCLCRSHPTRPAPASVSSTMPSTLRTVQKCAFNTSAPTSPSLGSSNRPDADCHATHTSIDTSSSSSSKSENPSTVYINPHRAKRIWPPDVSKLSQKQQFRLERKYRRRAKLKWARPTWTKWTKLVQWAAIGWVMVYCVLFLDLEEKANPFQPIRDYVHQSLKGLLSTAPPPSFQKEPTKPAPKAAKNDS